MFETCTGRGVETFLEHKNLFVLKFFFKPQIKFNSLTFKFFLSSLIFLHKIHSTEKIIKKAAGKFMISC